MIGFLQVLCLITLGFFILAFIVSLFVGKGKK